MSYGDTKAEQNVLWLYWCSEKVLEVVSAVSSLHRPLELDVFLFRTTEPRRISLRKEGR